MTALVPSPATDGHRQAVAGDVLLRWPVVTALAVLVANDHWWKWHVASWWTGKLSGVAALVLVPFVAVALVEVLTGRIGGRRAVRIAMWVGLVAAAAMAVVETTAVGVAAYEAGLGLLRWPLDAMVALLGGSGLPPLRPVEQFADVTDLLTLPAAALPALWLSRRVTAACGSPTGRGRPG